MGQANVAREPSMEEILASIRKIIESNEDEEGAVAPGGTQQETAAGNGGDEGNAPTVMQAANEQSTPDTTMTAERAKMRLDAARADASQRMRTPEDQQAGPPKPHIVEPKPAPEPAGETSSKPVSLAEVAAEAESSTKSAIEDAIRQQREAQAPAGAHPERRGQAPAEPQTISPGITGDRDEDRGIRRRVPGSAPASGEAGQIEGRALISATAGAKVAASFDSLNHALVQGPDRSFDEIAEDMLRPMLQQWLDDNLPTLVERLVREEIERVARGS